MPANLKTRNLVTPIHPFPVQHCLLITLLVSLSAKTLAEPYSFDYVQATFASSTINLSASPQELKGNGIGFSLSLGFNPHYAMTLSVLDTNFKTFQNIPVDGINKSALGITVHTTIADKTAIFGNAALLKTKITSSSDTIRTDDSDIGYRLQAGARYFLSTSFELELGLTHFYTFDQAANTLSAEVRYYTRKQLSIGLAYATGDNKNFLALNGRMNF